MPNENTRSRPTLSFDGKGLNGPDEYRRRVATFSSAADAKLWGGILAAAPDMLEALRALLREAEGLHGQLNDERLLDGWDADDEDVSLTTARAVIARAEGREE